MMTPKHLSPHQHKRFTELMALVKFRIDLVARTHLKLEHEFSELYALTGDETFRQTCETLHQVPRPLLHQELTQ
jgi:hypothetical protein